VAARDPHVLTPIARSSFSPSVRQGPMTAPPHRLNRRSIDYLRDERVREHVDCFRSRRPG
jgi:hypothetical protein